MLSAKLKLGMKISKTYKVLKEDTADYIGNPGVVMFSTPAMIKYMELTSGDMVFPHLPEGYNPVGTRVCISHLAPTPVGAEVRVKSTLVDMDRSRLTFQVEAWYGDTLIGAGSYEQFVVELKRFLLYND